MVEEITLSMLEVIPFLIGGGFRDVVVVFAGVFCSVVVFLICTPMDGLCYLLYVKARISIFITSHGTIILLFLLFFLYSTIYLFRRRLSRS